MPSLENQVRSEAARPRERGVYYELFVIIDIFCRYVVGWMVSPAETGELAEAFIADALARQGITRISSPSTPTAGRR